MGRFSSFLRKMIGRTLELRGYRLRCSTAAAILQKKDGKYAAGILPGPIELLSEENLRKPIPGLSHLQPDEFGEDWAQWLNDFEQEI